MTVREEIVSFALEHECDPQELIQRHLDEHLAQLTGRYRALAADVLLKLPAQWDSHAEWEMVEGNIEHPAEGFQQDVDHHFAGARLAEWVTEDLPQHWVVVLCVGRLRALSDMGVRGVVVHELAHVASGLPTDPRFRNEQLSEDRADSIARWWGFEEELATLAVEQHGSESTR